MNIAIIGSGISGLSCALRLAQQGRYQVTLIESGTYLGGHTNTIDVTVDGITHAVDTGFLVFNERTYPNLIALFEELAVPTAKSEMSFSVSLGGEVEWAGTSLASVFAQKSNLVRPRFLAMLRDILRFNRAATAAVANGVAADIPLGEYLTRHHYSASFRDWYLLPMAGAIWSCPTATMLAYPFATYARFCHNHGLLQVANRPQWFTVAGGARKYVQRISEQLNRHGANVRIDSRVQRVRRTPLGVLIDIETNHHVHTERFDQVVLACHSDQSLALLADASDEERQILGAVCYQANSAWLHTDTAQLPQRRATWAAWNYLSSGPDTLGAREVAVTYLLNLLQPLPFTTPVMVTLNPLAPPAPQHVIRQIDYAHPVFDQAAIAAQQRLPSLQGTRRTWFAGAWTGYGFHEDGLKSGLAVAAALNRLGDTAQAAAPALLRIAA